MHGTITPLDRAKSSKTYTRVMEQINTAVSQLISSGIVEFGDPKIEWPSSTNYEDGAWSKARAAHIKALPPLGDVFVRKLTRKIASDLRRPIVTAETSYYLDKHGFTNVTVRRSKSRAPLVAQFFLLPDEKPGDHYGRYVNANKMKADKKSVILHKDKTNWYIGFFGEKGQRAYREWRKFIQTEPACRKALQLD